MATEFRNGSGWHFARRSELAGAQARLELQGDILVIDDQLLDAERLTATLRVVFGYDVQIRRASTLADAIEGVVSAKPTLVFLDDILKPSADALQAMPLLRRAGYSGPIIVVSGEVTHSRRSSLLTHGASDVIHKDDVDSVRVAEALSRIPAPEAGAASAD